MRAKRAITICPFLLGLTQQKGVNFDLPIGGNNRSFFNVVGTHQYIQYKIELFSDFQTLCNFVFFSGNKKDVV